MFKKLCPKCHQPSFSSCETGVWICPICGKDLTGVFHQDAESYENRPVLKQLEKHFSNEMNKEFQKGSSFNKYV